MCLYASIDLHWFGSRRNMVFRPGFGWALRFVRTISIAQQAFATEEVMSTFRASCLPPSPITHSLSGLPRKVAMDMAPRVFVLRRQRVLPRLDLTLTLTPPPRRRPLPRRASECVNMGRQWLLLFPPLTHSPLSTVTLLHTHSGAFTSGQRAPAASGCPSAGSTATRSSPSRAP